MIDARIGLLVRIRYELIRRRCCYGVCTCQQLDPDILFILLWCLNLLFSECTLELIPWWINFDNWTNFWCYLNLLRLSSFLCFDELLILLFNFESHLFDPPFFLKKLLFLLLENLCSQRFHLRLLLPVFLDPHLFLSQQFLLKLFIVPFLFLSGLFCTLLNLLLFNTLFLFVFSP